MDSTPSTGSFPSGHAAATLALWVGLAIIISTDARRRLVSVVAWIVAVLLALTVAFARAYRGMHHVTDVVAGLALGAAALAIALLAARVVSGTVARHRAPERLAVTATADTRAVGSTAPSPSAEVAR
jgi:undecaprenyl-diphosphatase